MTNVMIVEDDSALRAALVDTLELAGYATEAYSSAEDALEDISDLKIGIVITDVNLGGMDGHQLLSYIKAKRPELPVLLMTAYGTISQAVSALQDGAVDYLIKPFEPSTLVFKVQQYIYRIYSKNVKPIVEDSRSKALISLALRVAPSDATVLITGPSGAGKEVLARYIHDNSNRTDKSFVAINCAAIPENMLEATLFGHEKGAFTGAHQSNLGKFEQAQGGTILLDEISEMDLGLQAKLLRVLQEKELERIGGKKVIKLDVRVIATSNRDLQAQVKAGAFREDLFYRLNVFPLHWLPLKARPADIMPLAQHLIARHAVEMGRVTPVFDDLATQAMLNHSWPGNAREMSNVIQRALIMQPGNIIHAEDLHITPIAIHHQPETMQVQTTSLSDDIKMHEFEKIQKVLAEVSGNRGKAAQKLGISPRTLRYKLARMREIGLQV